MSIGKKYEKKTRDVWGAVEWIPCDASKQVMEGGVGLSFTTHAGHGKKHLCRIVKVFWDQVVTTTFLYTQNTSHAVSLRYIRCLCWEKNMDLSILWSKTASLLPNCSHKKIDRSWIGKYTWISWLSQQDLVEVQPTILTTVPKFGMIKFLKSDSQFWWKPSFLLMVFFGLLGGGCNSVMHDKSPLNILKPTFARWWFQICSIFTLDPWGNDPNCFAHMFQKGWFNHQLPLDPKSPWKMKVLHPQYMRYNP